MAYYIYGLVNGTIELKCGGDLMHCGDAKNAKKRGILEHMLERIFTTTNMLYLVRCAATSCIE